MAAISESEQPRSEQSRSEQSRSEGSLDGSVRLDLYRTMVLIRTYEERIRQEYHADKTPGFDIGAGKIPGEMHLAAGQEPVAAGVCRHLRPYDALTATHRPHHLAIAHGVDLAKMAAEIFGREGGLGHGRGGHMHLFDPAVHFEKRARPSPPKCPHRSGPTPAACTPPRRPARHGPSADCATGTPRRQRPFGHVPRRCRSPRSSGSSADGGRDGPAPTTRAR